VILGRYRTSASFIADIKFIFDVDIVRKIRTVPASGGLGYREGDGLCCSRVQIAALTAIFYSFLQVSLEKKVEIV
jgi:hypothetical protein